jgi:hypothetical protein
MSDRSTPLHTVAGPRVELKLRATDATDGASPWNVLAYEVQLKGRTDWSGEPVTLTRFDFDDCVKNFARYGQVPVVLYHADTDPAAHPDAAKARGWVTELRVGSMVRGEAAVATLEGRLALDAATKTEVNADPPALAFCSITLVPGMRDEETGERIGAYLYSLSLTNKPALTDLPRLVASQGGSPVDELTKLAARLGLAVEGEDPGAALVALGMDLVKRLGLPAAFTARDLLEHVEIALTAQGEAVALAAKCADLERASAAKDATVTRLTARVSELEAAESARLRAEAEREVRALQAAGRIAATPKALESAVKHRLSDPEGFAALFAGLPDPEAMRPRVAEVDEKTLSGTVAGTVVGEPPPPHAGPSYTDDDRVHAKAKELMRADPNLSLKDALLTAGRELKRRS